MRRTTPPTVRATAVTSCAVIASCLRRAKLKRSVANGEQAASGETNVKGP
jgi:hypothetical protein